MVARSCEKRAGVEAKGLSKKSAGRRDTGVSIGLGFALFGVYAWGACPTIYVGDSGELVTAVHVLGIPHPSGYPLYVLLGKLWSVLVPGGSLAWRMSLFSAACAAAASAVLYRTCRSIGLHPTAALAAALLLAFSPSFWGEANVQRVYALNALFVASAAAAIARWLRSGERRFVVVAFFLSGLGASNHTFMAVYAAALALLVVSSRSAFAVAPRVWSASCAAFALGLLPYLYLPLRSRADPPLDWGDPEGFTALLEVVLRRDFWARAWVETPADLAAAALDFLRSFATELTWAGVALALLGALAKCHRRIALLCVLVAIANLSVMAIHGSRSDLFIWHRYYIPSYFMAALLAGMGSDLVVRRLPNLLRGAPLLIPLLLLVRGWEDFDRSRYRVAEEFSRALLRSLPPGSHLAASDDNVLFALLYLKFVEELRPDVHLIPQGVDTELPPLRFDPDDEPLFFTHHPNWSFTELEIVPRGLVFQARHTGQPPAPLLPFPSHLQGETDPAVSKDYLTRNLIGHFRFMLGCSFEQRDWPRARRELEAAAAAAPDNDVLHYNVGLIYARNGLLEDALAAFRRSDAINSRPLPSRSRPRAADRIVELEREADRVAAVERTLAAAGRLRGDLVGGTPAFHEQVAGLLESGGEALAAHAHRLRAQEIRAFGLPAGARRD